MFTYFLLFWPLLLSNVASSTQNFPFELFYSFPPVSTSFLQYVSVYLKILIMLLFQFALTLLLVQMVVLLFIAQPLIVLERTGVVSLIISEMFGGYLYMIRVIMKNITCVSAAMPEFF